MAVLAGARTSVLALAILAGALAVFAASLAFAIAGTLAIALAIAGTLTVALACGLAVALAVTRALTVALAGIAAAAALAVFVAAGAGVVFTGAVFARAAALAVALTIACAAAFVGIDANRAGDCFAGRRIVDSHVIAAAVVGGIAAAGALSTSAAFSVSAAAAATAASTATTAAVSATTAATVAMMYHNVIAVVAVIVDIDATATTTQPVIDYRIVTAADDDLAIVNNAFVNHGAADIDIVARPLDNHVPLRNDRIGIAIFDRRTFDPRRGCDDRLGERPAGRAVRDARNRRDRGR